MKKINLTLCVLSSIFLISSCAPQVNESGTSGYGLEDIKTRNTVVTFSMLYDSDGGNEHFYYKSDFDGLRFDYLRSDKLEPLSLTFGDYLEITFTGDIYCEAIYPPNCYMDGGEIISIKKTEHATELYQYRIIDGVGTFVSESSTYIYYKPEFYLTDGNRAHPFDTLNDGDYLTGYYSPVEDEYDENGNVIHNIAAFYKDEE